MSNVTPFQSKVEYLWVCSCGCSTFELLDTGHARCAACAVCAPEEQGGWYAPEDASEWVGDAPVRDVQGNGSVEFARRRVAQLAQEPDVVATIVVRSDGTVHSWSSAETAAQFSWLRRQLVAAYRSIRRMGDA